MIAIIKKQAVASTVTTGIVPVKSRGVLDRWTDAVVLGYHNNQLHIIGGADHAVTSTNLHYVYDLNGNRVAKFTAPFTVRADCPYSLLGGKITIIGGDGGSVSGRTDIWQFDYSIAGNTVESWTQITSDFTPSIGGRILSFFCDHNGWFYIGGGQTKTDVYKTQDFLTWTLVCNLPLALQYSATAACVSFNNKIWIIGGATGGSNEFGATALYNANLAGKVFSLSGTTITEELTDQSKFGSLWGNAVTSNQYIYYIKGTITGTQLSQFPEGTTGGNQKGMYRSADGVTWEVIDSLPARHATGVCNVDGVPYLACGNFSNGIYKIIE